MLMSVPVKSTLCNSERAQRFGETSPTFSGFKGKPSKKLAEAGGIAFSNLEDFRLRYDDQQANAV
jgi:hypothetical protein